MEIWNTVWPILVAIVIFGLIIFIHEFGHFLFAKIFKIRVNEFAIGFGPAIFKKKKGETLYAVRILPFGGYCAMEGENGQEVPSLFPAAEGAGTGAEDTAPAETSTADTGNNTTGN